MNKLINFMKERFISEDYVIFIVEKELKKGSRSKYLMDRFTLYAKERIKQKKLSGGTRVEAVKNVINSKEFKILHVRWGKKTKNSSSHILNQLIAEKHSRARLLHAFKNEGESKII